MIIKYIRHYGHTTNTVEHVLAIYGVGLSLRKATTDADCFSIQVALSRTVSRAWSIARSAAGAGFALKNAWNMGEHLRYCEIIFIPWIFNFVGRASHEFKIPPKYVFNVYNLKILEIKDPRTCPHMAKGFW